jgi:hypothetical protein
LTDIHPEVLNKAQISCSLLFSPLLVDVLLDNLQNIVLLLKDIGIVRVEHPLLELRVEKEHIGFLHLPLPSADRPCSRLTHLAPYLLGHPLGYLLGCVLSLRHSTILYNLNSNQRIQASNFFYQ